MEVMDSEFKISYELHKYVSFLNFLNCYELSSLFQASERKPFYKDTSLQSRKSQLNSFICFSFLMVLFYKGTETK